MGVIKISSDGFALLTNGNFLKLDPFVFEEPPDLTQMNNHIDVAAGTLRDLRLVASSSEFYTEEMPRQFYGLPVYLEFGQGFPYQRYFFGDAIDEDGYIENARELAEYSFKEAGEFDSWQELTVEQASENNLELCEGHEWGDYPSDITSMAVAENALSIETKMLTEKSPEIEENVAQQMIDRFDGRNKFTMEEAEATFSHLLSGRGIRRAWERAR
jgi:hypothetical protein